MYFKKLKKVNKYENKNVKISIISYRANCLPYNYNWSMNHRQRQLCQCSVRHPGFQVTGTEKCLSSFCPHQDYQALFYNEFAELRLKFH